jgi:hypothetical protein
LNQLQDKYESKGLSIIGVTSESQSSTEPWVSKHGARYAYGYNSGSLKGKFPGGIPMAILVDPSGNIVWKGHPSSLKDGDIERALAGALETPMWEWPASAKSVRSSLKKHKYAKALAQAEELGDAGLAIHQAVQGMVTGKLAALKGLHKKGDYLGATELAATLEKELKGLPEQSEIKTIAGSIKADKQAQSILKAQKKLQSMMEGRIKKAKVPAMIKNLEKLMAEYDGTFLANQVEEFIGQLRKKYH